MKMTVEEFAESFKSAKTLEELTEAVKNGDFELDSHGKSVKIKLYRGKDGIAKTEIMEVADLPDISTMSYDDLEDYCAELDSERSDLEDEEPEDVNSEEHAAWEEKIEELDDKIDEAEDRLTELESLGCDED